MTDVVRYTIRDSLSSAICRRDYTSKEPSLWLSFGFAVCQARFAFVVQFYERNEGAETSHRGSTKRKLGSTGFPLSDENFGFLFVLSHLSFSSRLQRDLYLCSERPAFTPIVSRPPRSPYVVRSTNSISRLDRITKNQRQLACSPETTVSTLLILYSSSFLAVRS